jgi:hypothetical protein
VLLLERKHSRGSEAFKEIGVTRAFNESGVTRIHGLAFVKKRKCKC